MNSHDLIAKKYSTIASSAVIANSVSVVVACSIPGRRYIALSSLDVIALCWCFGGSSFANALRRARTNGIRWELPLTCTGLGRRLLRNAEARWLAACRTVLATTGFERLPSNFPQGFHLAWR